MLDRPDKDALRAMLESQVQEKRQHDPGAVITYAAKSVPDRKPYTSKPTVQDKAFHKELEQMRADAEAGVILMPKREPEDGGGRPAKLMIIRICKTCRRDFMGVEWLVGSVVKEITSEKATNENHHRRMGW